MWLIRGEGIWLRPRRDAVKERDYRGNGRHLWFFHVVFEDVSDVGDEKEVKDVIVVLDVKVYWFVVKTLVGKRDNGWEQVSGSSLKSFG